MQRTVFVVDDDELVRKTLDRVLTRAGYSVVLSADGREALEKLPRHEARVFILDLSMPVMNGVDLCREIKKSNGSTCIVYALTGHADDFDLYECRQAGFDDYFVKPFRINMILKMVEQAFDKIQRWNKIAGKR